jgi:microsomal dipeptidase-like Zn-dependent dipeptidase
MPEETTLVDLHAHYPMHLIPRVHGRTNAIRAAWRVARLKAKLIGFISLFLNYQGHNHTPGVRVELMRNGRVAIAASVLYPPIDEFLPEHGEAPDPESFGRLKGQIETVEEHLRHSELAAVAYSGEQINSVRAAGKIAVLHCVEGGLLIGASPAQIATNVAWLAGEKGLLYITPAHLFYRGIAAQAPALPFLTDKQYKDLFPIPDDVKGLTDLGRALVTECVANRVLVDVTHMTEEAIDVTLELIDQLDREAGRDQPTPVIASHMACRLSDVGLGYNLSERHIKAIADRGGVMGLINCPHYLSDADVTETRSRSESMSLVRTHIDRIHELTGSHQSIAVGTDLDGYCKPALYAYEDEQKMGLFQDDLVDIYGLDVARGICSRNALEILKWRYPGLNDSAA